MATLSRKLKPATLAILFSLSLPYAAANAEYAPPFVSALPQGGYVGIFGGGGTANKTSIRQRGTAFFPAALGGPLFVNATGHGSINDGIGGMIFGYECPQWMINTGLIGNALPGIELEGYYLGGTLNGELINPTPRLPEHDFKDSFQMNNGVILVNAILSFNTFPMSRINPYIGAGVGTSIVSISNANSAQLSPPEPGINHFNSGRNASNWRFAAQGKAGLRFILDEHWRLLLNTDICMLHLAIILLVQRNIRRMFQLQSGKLTLAA